MRNYYRTEPDQYVKIGEYERNCHEFFLAPFDLVLVYTKFIQQSYCWMGFCVFNLHSISVPEDYLGDMLEFCQNSDVIVYDEQLLNRMLK